LQRDLGPCHHDVAIIASTRYRILTTRPPVPVKIAPC
jgi:hypothetical protein